MHFRWLGLYDGRYFNITVGQTFSGGFIDYILFGVLQGNDKTNYLWVIPIGIVWFVLYYVIFRTLITVLTLRHLVEKIKKHNTQ